MTMALRMTELAISQYLRPTSSFREPEIRPFFQEIDFLVQKESASDEKNVLKTVIDVAVSFLSKGQLKKMGCECHIKNEIEQGDWQPHAAVLFDSDGCLLERFYFKEFKQVISY